MPTASNRIRLFSAAGTGAAVEPIRHSDGPPAARPHNQEENREETNSLNPGRKKARGHRTHEDRPEKTPTQALTTERQQIDNETNDGEDEKCRSQELFHAPHRQRAPVRAEGARKS